MGGLTHFKRMMYRSCEINKIRKSLTVKRQALERKEGEDMVFLFFM
jgi:hypothetical protein